MTYEQLKAFIAVAEQGGFRGAAKVLFKTQPTVSSAIKTLEDQFSFELFTRDSYRPMLTPEGKLFLVEAKQLVSSSLTLEKLGHHLAAGVSPSLGVCISPVLCPKTGLSRIRQFQKSHPNIRLVVTTAHLKGVQAQFEADKVELAISPYYGFGERYEFIEVDRIEMITVISPDALSKLSSATSKVSQLDLYAIPHVLIEDSSSESFDHVNVLPFGEKWYVGDYALKLSLLLEGLGWARIPKHMVERDLQEGRLICIDVEGFNSASYVPMYLMRDRSKLQSVLAERFWQYLVQKA